MISSNLIFPRDITDYMYHTTTYSKRENRPTFCINVAYRNILVNAFFFPLWLFYKLISNSIAFRKQNQSVFAKNIQFKKAAIFWKPDKNNCDKAESPLTTWKTENRKRHRSKDFSLVAWRQNLQHKTSAKHTTINFLLSYGRGSFYY